MDTTNSSEKPQRRVEDRKPAEVIDWAAPGAPAVPLSPAATSGDAPDLQQLKALALAATPGPWLATHWNGHAPTTVMRAGTTTAIAETTGFGRDSRECAPDAAYIAAANPAVVLGLIARIESAAAPAPSEYRKLTGDLTLKELAAEFCAVAELGGDVTLSAGACRKLFEAMTTPPAAAPATASGDELPRPDCTYADHSYPAYSANLVRKIRDEARAAVSAATKPTADLSSLQRYGEVAEANGSGEYVAKMADGEFYKVKDVQSLVNNLQGQPNV